MQVKDLMTSEVVSVAPDASVSEVAKVLLDYAISGVPVVEDGKIIGIVTEEDLVIRNAVIDMPHYIQMFSSVFYLGNRGEIDRELHKVLATVARDLMSGPVVTISQDASAQELATLMVKKNINPVPVVDAQGALVGIISRADLVRLMVAEQQVTDDSAELPEGTP